MKRDTLKTAISEAKLFIKKADLLEQLLDDQVNDKYSSLNPKESGAVKRASMDLTRALADLRQNR